MTQPPDADPFGWASPQEVPPAYDAGPAAHGQSPLPATPEPTRPRNVLATIALITGLLGMVCVSLVAALLAMTQIRGREQRGMAMAVAGLTASVLWLVATGVVSMVIVAAGDGGSGSFGGSALQPIPGAGQCFDFHNGRKSANIKIVTCYAPHHGEMVALFTLPAGPWPGDAEVARQGTTRCEEEIRALFRTSVPDENGSPFVLFPRERSWRLGDRRVRCAIAGDQGRKLTQRLRVADQPRRRLTNLHPGDCFTDRKGGRAATIVTCAQPHRGQVTHRFELTGEPNRHYGEIEASAREECTIRMDRELRNLPKRRLGYAFEHPTKETWRSGDRTVICYVTGVDEQLFKGSVSPR